MEQIDLVFKEIDRLYYDCARWAGMPVTAYYILLSVRQEAGCTQAEICARWGLSRQTVNSALSALRRQGLLALGTGPDGRSKGICLTPEGEDWARRFADPVLRREAAAWQALTPEERAVYESLSRRYCRALRGQLEALWRGEK